MKIGQHIEDARAKMYRDAALRVTPEVNEAGDERFDLEGNAIIKSVESRISEDEIRAQVIKAATDGSLAFGQFKSGTVGSRVAWKFVVKNEADEEFDVNGSILITVPGSVLKKS